MQSNTDQLPRLLCSKYPGGRSALYNKWEEEMLDAAAGKGDEDASWAVTRFPPEVVATDWCRLSWQPN